MKKEEIKIGQKVAYVGTVFSFTSDTARIGNEKDGLLLTIDSLQPYPELITEPAPERLFKKGDVVKINLRNGRLKFKGITEGKNYELLTDEKDGFSHIISDIEDRIMVAFSGLILVTPVEERKIYKVKNGILDGDDKVVCEGRATLAIFSKELPNANSLAHELADRLNREVLEG